MHIILLFGPPGAGKGTQSELITQKYNFLHVSTGELLRDEIKKKTEIGRIAQERIDVGEFAPDEIAIKLVTQFIEQNREAKGIVFDGFPRNTAQAVLFDQLLLPYDLKVGRMISLEVEKTELINRILLRASSSNRPDDADTEIIHKRLDIYKQRTEPLKQYYSQQGKFMPVDGNGDLTHIFERISKILDTI